MSTTLPSHVVATCPGCGAKTKTPVANAGKRARCTRCGKVFRVPSPEDDGATPKERPPQRLAIGPTVSFDCWLCGTRLTAPVQAVGRRVRCPDCEALTVAPEPPPPKPADIPAAMLEESYELYEGDDQPTAAELMAAQPATIPVHCGLCQTLMHAGADQVGQQVTCPDCGEQTRVPPPTIVRPMIDLTHESYDVHAPTEPQPPNEAVRALLEEGARQAAQEAVATPERPALPRVPLLQGVTRMLLEANVVSRWAVLSGVFVIALTLFAYGGSALGGIGGGRVAMAAGAVMGVCLAVLAGLMMVIALGFLAALAVSIVTESSEGNDRLQQTPSSNPTDWLGEAFTLAIAVTAAAAPGWWGGFAVGGPPLAAIGGFGSLLLLAPLVLLSQLDLGSPVGLLSPKLLAATPRVAGSVLLFWIEALLLAGAVAACLAPLVAVIELYAVAVVAPLALAATLLYFRLLGRLAWLIAERTGR